MVVIFLEIVLSGVGAALDLAVKKGYLGKEKDKTIKKGKKNRIEADNYSIEDKRYEYVFVVFSKV